MERTQRAEGPAVVRLLRWFERDPGAAILGEEPLGGVQLSQLQALFRRPPSDPMFDCYAVAAPHTPVLQQWVAHRIDLARHDYFVEAEAKAS